MRRFPPLALACALIIPAAAQARPYTVDDLLKLEELGPVQMAPGGRWGVIQTLAPWDQAPLYDLDWWTRYGLGRLQRVDLQDGAVRPLLPQDAGSGYIAGPFSPSGARMAVCRLTGHAWELGVVDVASGAVRWLGLQPELPQRGQEVAWRGDDELLVIAQSEDPVGHRLGFGWQAQARLTAAWSEAAAGRLAVTALGSGRYLDLRAKASPRRLVRVRLGTGREDVLVSGDLFDLEPAPDGRTVAVLANGEDLQDVNGPTSTGTSLYRRKLFLVDPDSGVSVEPCPTCDIMQGLLSWSSRGDRLLIYARQGGGWASGAFQIVDARAHSAAPAAMAGLAAVMSKKRNNGELAVGAWLGDTPVVYARPAASGRADWYALPAGGPQVLTADLTSPSPSLVANDARSLTVRDGPTLWRVAADGKARRLATPAGAVLTLGANAWEPERRAPTSAPSTASLVSLGREGLSPFRQPHRVRLSLHADETPLAVAADLGAAILSRTDPHGVERLTLRQAGHADRDLITVNSALEAIEPAEVRAIHHKGPDGQALTSWLYLPPGLRPGEKPPLVVVPYPGLEFAVPPAAQALGSNRLHVNAQVLAAAGYAVLMPSLPYAKDREPMDGLADQVLSVVDAVAAQAPVDTGRLAVWGHSYGGYTALALATESPRFKVVIAGAAASNLTSVYATLGPYSYAVPEGGLSVMGSAGWSETGQARMNGPPWSDPDLYRRNSPITFVDRIVAPVLLMWGDMDGDITQAEQVFTSLYRQNKDAELLIYHGENHVVSSPANVRDEYARALAFLGEHIGPPAALKP